MTQLPLVTCHCSVPGARQVMHLICSFNAHVCVLPYAKNEVGHVQRNLKQRHISHIVWLLKNPLITVSRCCNRPTEISTRNEWLHCCEIHVQDLQHFCFIKSCALKGPVVFTWEFYSLVTRECMSGDECLVAVLGPGTKQYPIYVVNIDTTPVSPLHSNHEQEIPWKVNGIDIYECTSLLPPLKRWWWRFQLSC